MSQKILLSGVKPTGRPHIGNYFGAMKQFVDLQSAHKCLFMIADYHALNFVQNGDEMRNEITELALDYLAIGIDPAKSILFKQSDISAHTELTWIFNTITTMPYLMRAHAFKDAEAKNKDISVGAFDYPILMAADILLYGTDVVPVGQDQKQHIEYTRDIAEKFNHIFGETFKLPNPIIIESVKTVPGLDGQKMSKSYGNTIPLFATDEEIEKAVKKIVTDSSAGIPVNVFNIHLPVFQALGKGDEETLKALYNAREGKYKELKDLLTEDLKAFIGPMRARREALSVDKAKVVQIIKEGGVKAKEIADKKLVEAKKAIGVEL